MTHNFTITTTTHTQISLTKWPKNSIAYANRTIEIKLNVNILDLNLTFSEMLILNEVCYVNYLQIIGTREPNTFSYIIFANNWNSPMADEIKNNNNNNCATNLVRRSSLRGCDVANGVYVPLVQRSALILIYTYLALRHIDCIYRPKCLITRGVYLFFKPPNVFTAII